MQSAPTGLIFELLPRAHHAHVDRLRSAVAHVPVRNVHLAPDIFWTTMWLPKPWQLRPRLGARKPYIGLTCLAFNGAWLIPAAGMPEPRRQFKTVQPDRAQELHCRNCFKLQGSFISQAGSEFCFLLGAGLKHGQLPHPKPKSPPRGHRTAWSVHLVISALKNLQSWLLGQTPRDLGLQ